MYMFSFATYTSASMKVRGLKPRCSVRRCRCGSVEGMSEEEGTSEEEGAELEAAALLPLPEATGAPRVDLRDVMPATPSCEVRAARRERRGCEPGKGEGRMSGAIGKVPRGLGGVTSTRRVARAARCERTGGAARGAPPAKAITAAAAWREARDARARAIIERP